MEPQKPWEDLRSLQEGSIAALLGARGAVPRISLWVQGLGPFRGAVPTSSLHGGLRKLVTRPISLNWGFRQLVTRAPLVRILLERILLYIGVPDFVKLPYT